MTTSISLRILLSGILRENCELPIMSPARQFREKCRKREITGEKRRFHSHACDRPNYVSSQPRYDHFDISAYSITRIFYHISNKKSSPFRKIASNIKNIIVKPEISLYFENFPSGIGLQNCAGVIQ